MTFEQQQALIDDAMHARAVALSALITSLARATVDPVLELVRALRAAHARRQLYSLSDRMLKDIGLSRGEIESLFR